VKWQFCDDQTPAQKEYIAAVKAGTVDPLEMIQKSMGSKGGQSFCGPSNGFLVEGRPLIPTEENRITLRNEARCANFGTDPLVGAMEWLGREIKREYHETEFEKARLIVADLSAPKGGCVSGRAGRRAHKSHTGGLDVDFAFFNPRASYPPEERFTRNFYVASNWWLLKKLFKNPFACVKIVFVDRKHIRTLERYAKDDPEWSKLKKYVRHVRGHRDHFHVRVGSGPGVPGCAADPSLEEDEDPGDESELALALNPLDGVMEEAANEGAEETPPSGVLTAAPSDEDADADELTRGVASQASLVAATLPPHKLEPSITAKYTEKKKRRRTARHVRKRRRK
jgi:murein endopeptidase